MTGKTHLVAGMAVSMAVMTPQSPKEILISVMAGAIGGIISDIDVSTSGARRDLNIVTGIVAVLCVAAMFLEFQFHYGIIKAVKNHGLWQMMIGFCIVFLLCLFGKTTPHRSFTHSFLAVGLLTTGVWMILPAAALPFAVAMASHIVLDLCNYKRLRLLYPMKKGFSMRLCRGSGKVDRVLFYIIFLIDIGLIAWIIFFQFIHR